MTGAVLTLVACGAPSTEPSSADPYALEFEQSIESSSSDFVKAVLADHHVTDAEFSESQDSLVACLREEGFEPVITTDAGRRMVNIPADAPLTCFDEWSGDIEPLYWAERVNPANADMYDLVAACMVRTGLAPTGFTGVDLKQLEDDSSYSFTQLADGSKIDEKPPKNPGPPLLPSGMMIYAPETQGCWTWPLTTGVE